LEDKDVFGEKVLIGQLMRMGPKMKKGPKEKEEYQTNSEKFKRLFVKAFL